MDNVNVLRTGFYALDFALPDTQGNIFRLRDDLSGHFTALCFFPDGENEKISVIESGKMRLPVMERVGLYLLEFPNGDRRTFAVNLLDDKESDISPKTQLSLTGQTLEANDSAIRRFNQPLWPYIVATVLCLVCVEWFVYNRKVRI